MKDKNVDIFDKSLVRDELKLTILKTIQNFNSEEISDYELTNEDILYVLSSIITRKLE